MVKLKFLASQFYIGETRIKQANRSLTSMLWLVIFCLGASASAKSQNDEFQPVQPREPTANLVTLRGELKPYASVGVWEAGGSLSWAHAADVDAFSVTPAVGYFVADNFELSLLTQLHYDRLRTYPENNPPKQNKSTQFNILVEPSTHLPVVDNVYVFAGFGVGLAFSDQNPNIVLTTTNNQVTASSKVAFAMAPRIGLNFAIGQSGVLSPSVALNWSDDGNMQIINNQRLSGVHTSWATHVGYSMIW